MPPNQTDEYNEPETNTIPPLIESFLQPPPIQYDSDYIKQTDDNFFTSFDENLDQLHPPTAISPLNDPTKFIRWKDAVPQILASCIGYLANIQVGFNMSYSSILIPQLSDPLCLFTITKSEASWIASLVTISLPIGAVLGGILTDRFGRKKLMLSSCIPFLIGWLMIASTKGVYQIYGARIIAGMAGGMTTIVLVYVSEISHPLMRPMLLSFNSVFVSMGILMTSVLGWRFFVLILL